MAPGPFNPSGKYQPESTIELPALYSWPRARSRPCDICYSKCCFPGGISLSYWLSFPGIT